MPLLVGNSPFRAHINFVTDQHTRNFLIDITTIKNKILIHLIVPMRDIIKTLVISNIINNDDSMCASIIAISNSSEPLLSCSVPLFYKNRILLRRVCIFIRLRRCILLSFYSIKIYEIDTYSVKEVLVEFVLLWLIIYYVHWSGLRCMIFLHHYFLSIISLGYDHCIN